MYEKIISKLKNKNIAILGFGREGKSTYNFIKKYLKQKVTILDRNDFNIDDNDVLKIVGDNYLDNLDKYDLIIKSPGISLKDIDLSRIEDKITSQLELLLEVYKDNIIGITGTKGKSTTTCLLYEVIKKQFDNTFLLGNIGIPVFDEIENYTEDSILVIEMSSHQLEFIKVSPHIGIVLNLYEDHLDHDGTVEHYHHNKMNILRFQNENDYAIYSSDDDNIRRLIEEDNYKGIKHTIRFDNEELEGNYTRIKDKEIFFNGELIYEDKERLLLGNHNLKNIMFVLTVIKYLGFDVSKAYDVIRNFKGLKYRMEYIGTYNDIKYYNDTIATIPEATISAISAIGDVDTLIFGGMDRKINYNDFINYLSKSNINNFICMPTTGNIIGKELEKVNKNVLYTEKLEEAFNLSQKYTKKHMTCLLSPAAASYEFFKNFEEKGKAFEDIVKKSNI